MTTAVEKGCDDMKQKKDLYIVIPLLLICAFVYTTELNVLQHKSEANKENHENILKAAKYPPNENNETYGADIKELVDNGPDLILAKNKSGLIGYIRASDMNANEPATPEDAAAYQKRSYYIPMYLSDGYTRIGVFEIGGD